MRHALVLVAMLGCSRPQEHRPAPTPAPPVVENAVAQVESWSSLVVSNAHGDAQLRRTAAGWRLVKPVVAEADEQTVHTLLRALGAPLALHTAHAHATQLRTWGLTPPRFVVRATGEGGRTAAIRGGAEDSFDGSVALQREGDDAVYRIPGGAAQALEPSVYALRDKSVLHARPDEVVRVEVTRGKTRVAVLRSPDRTWKTDDKKEAPAPAIRRALQEDTTLRFLSFLEKRRGDPLLEVTWEQTNKMRTTVRVLSEGPNGLQVALLRGEIEVFGVLPGSALGTWRSEL